MLWQKNLFYYIKNFNIQDIRRVILKKKRKKKAGFKGQIIHKK